MISLYAVAGILFFLALIVLGAYFIARQKTESEPASPDQVIHTSGIYSIVRRSPREDLYRIRPTERDLKQYLKDQSVDINGSRITDSDRKRMASMWSSVMESNISMIENGDYKGCEFYYYDYSGVDKVCSSFIDKGHYVTREEIFKHPELIPPFHPGCTCVLNSHFGGENPRETTVMGMRPLFRDNDTLPPLPDWKNLQKPE